MDGIFALFDLVGLFLQAAVYLVVFIVVAILAAIDARKGRLSEQLVESDNRSSKASVSIEDAFGVLEGVITIALALIAILILHAANFF
ncbi:MAG: hypothetical protein K2Z81_27450 [Cyanobacteria bacterium]|nr:hypothetical protein [Cyanobacteriota bacterium]